MEVWLGDMCFNYSQTHSNPKWLNFCKTSTCHLVKRLPLILKKSLGRARRDPEGKDSAAICQKLNNSFHLTSHVSGLRQSGQSTKLSFWLTKWNQICFLTHTHVRESVLANFSENHQFQKFIHIVSPKFSASPYILNSLKLRIRDSASFS